MKEKLDKYIKQHHLFKKEDKLILAISGGADSVALACLLKALNSNFIIDNIKKILINKDNINLQTISPKIKWIN